MQIGEIIRQNRKRKNLTQEEMANRLGVSAPAVNKWENGNSQPDIMMLAPIARLLDITIDTLLSFQEEPTSDEINNMIREAAIMLKTQSYEEVFQWAIHKMNEFPNSEQLIWQIAVFLDAWRLTRNIPESEKYDSSINKYYIRALESKDEDIRTSAADSLFGFYLRKEQYEKAEEYLSYYSKQNPERKRKQAVIYSKTNQLNEAYKKYEELLFSGYQMINMIFHSIYLLAMEENDIEKARFLIEKQKELAHIFEMGKYHEVSCSLDLVTFEKDIEATIDTMEQMLNSIEKICDFRDSSLFKHMEFKEISTEFSEEMKKNLLHCFGDEETYGYMEENGRWKIRFQRDCT